MSLIVKSSIDILPWTEMEKQKLIEEKEKKFKKIENKTEKQKEEKEEKENIENNFKHSTENTKPLKGDKKKEVTE